MKKRLNAFVSGFVQGVSFRYFVHFHAQKLGLNGFVRNSYDGSVEVVAEGEEKDLLSLLDLLKRGPSLSKVEKVSANWFPATGEFSFFSVEH